MEEKLYQAAKSNSVGELEDILRRHPRIDVNQQNTFFELWTPLHVACYSGFQDIVAALLAHPNINVNQKNEGGDTPFMVAAYYGRAQVVRLLLRDPRVDIWEPSFDEYTPLRLAASQGHLETIKWMIASGRRLDLGVEGHWRNDAIGGARKERKFAVVKLLERFKQDPERTTTEVKAELRIPDTQAAELFALVVFLCDDFVSLPMEKSKAKDVRFFTIARSLPMELQMALCHRACGSPKSNIPQADSEIVFRTLTKWLSRS